MKSQPESSSQHDHPAIPSISTPSKRESPVNEVSTDQRPTNPPAIPTAISKPASTTTSALAPKTIPTPDQNKSSAQAPGHHLAAGHAKDDLLSREAAVRKRKYTTIGYGADEVDIIERTATSLHLALLQDQQITLFPPAPTAFTSFSDVVDRLLPYHIWQIHDEELEGEKKGKRKELREAHDAEKLIKRIQGVEERFAKVRRRDGHRPSDLPSLISLVQASTTVLRDEISVIQQSLRSARTKYDTSEAVRRAREKARAEESLRLSRKSAPSTPSSAIRPASKIERTRASVTTPSPAISSFSTSERGKGRGRPRGRGGGASHDTVLTHTPNGRGSTEIEDSIPLKETSTTLPGPSSTSTILAYANKLSVSADLANITVPTSAVNEFVDHGLMVLQPNVDDPKAPVSIIRTAEDAKTVVLSLNFKACNRDQLLDLRKLMAAMIPAATVTESEPA